MKVRRIFSFYSTNLHKPGNAKLTLLHSIQAGGTGSSVLTAENRVKDSVVLLETGRREIKVPARVPLEECSAVEIYYQAGRDDLENPRDRCIAMIVEQAFDEPLFNQLRQVLFLVLDFS